MSAKQVVFGARRQPLNDSWLSPTRMLRTIPDRIGVCMATLFGDPTAMLSRWLGSHFASGMVDDLFAYVDRSNSSDALLSYLRSLTGLSVSVIEWNGRDISVRGSTLAYHAAVSSHGSYSAYKHCAFSHMYTHKWLLFLDTDDFLRPQLGVRAIRERMFKLANTARARVVLFDWIEMDYCCMFAAWFDESRHGHVVERRNATKHGVVPYWVDWPGVHHSLRFFAQAPFADGEWLHEAGVTAIANDMMLVEHHRCRLEWFRDTTHQCAQPWMSVFESEVPLTFEHSNFSATYFHPDF